jgi:hypothetical protein
LEFEISWPSLGNSPWPRNADYCSGIPEMGRRSLYNVPPSRYRASKLHGHRRTDTLTFATNLLEASPRTSKMSKDLLLVAAVKAHNDTSGVNGLVPTLLVYGNFPRLPIRDENIDSPSNSERASMRSLAMVEYFKAIDEVKAYRNAQSPTDPVGLRPNNLVLVWKKPLKKWDGTLPLISGRQ